MKDTCTCPKCQMENAYYNGFNFECPDCDYEWSDNTATSSKNLGDFSIFEELTKLKVSFFKLEHGKLYNCKIKDQEGIKETSIIPLAFENAKNVQFVMTDARELFEKNPKFIREIIKMDYDDICNDGIRAYYPFEYDALTINCATQEDGSLIDYYNNVYFDFEKTKDIF